MIPVESRTLTIPTHHGHAFRVMNELRVREELCDISINVDGRHFHAHRVVLAGCSPYLRAMFTNGMLESEKSVVTIRGIDQETMLVLLDFMYTGTVCVSTDNVQALLQAASMLHLAGLRTYCSQFLQVHIDPGNCLGIQYFADMYSCSELETISKRYVQQHFSEVCGYEEFRQLSEERLLLLLACDRLQVSGENEVFEAALQWVSSRPEVRANCMCRLLQQVRLPLLDINYLQNVVLRTEYVRTCAKCQNLVANAIRIKGDISLAPGIHTRSQPQGIFVLGGRNSVDCQLKSVERYDFKEDRWHYVSSLGIARTAVGCASHLGVLYAVGGECAMADAQDDTQYLRHVEYCDLSSTEWLECSPMKVARSFVSVCELGNYLYAVGGEDRNGSFSVVEKYDPKEDEWEVVPDMQQKRAGAGVVGCNGRLYVAGGYDKSFHTDRASIECYDPDVGEWLFVAEMEKARSGLSLVSLDNCLFVLGGRTRYTDQYYDLVERYNTMTKQWTTLSPMNTPRAWPACAVVDNKIFVMGGFDGANRLRSVEVYDIESDTWSFISTMNVCRAGCGSAVV